MEFEGISSTALNVILLIAFFIFILGFSIFGSMIYSKWKRFQQFKCVVFEEDGTGNNIISYDQAGIFIDKKTNTKRLFLKNGQVGLDPDKVPYVMDKKGNLFIFLLKNGLKNYRYINIKISANNLQIMVGEEDVNWAINAYERQKKVFSQSLLMQYMPFIIIAFTTIVILLMFMWFFKKFDVLKDMASALKDAALAIRDASGGTKVV